MGEKFTPGPWVSRPAPMQPRKYRCVYFSRKRDEPYSTSPLEPADARLIAAAPDLLAACKAAKKAFEIFFRHRRKDMLIVDDAMNQLTAAINLAEPT